MKDGFYSAFDTQLHIQLLIADAPFHYLETASEETREH